MFEKIIWSTDGSELADTALPAVEELARKFGSKIVAVHAAQEFRGGRSAGVPMLADEDELLLKIRRQVDALELHGFNVQLIARRSDHDSAHVIAALADETHADLIVLATHGRGAVGTALFGSVAKELLHLAPCAVLAVPQPVGAAAVADVAYAIQSEHHKQSQDVASRTNPS